MSILISDIEKSSANSFISYLKWKLKEKNTFRKKNTLYKYSYMKEVTNDTKR